MTTTVANLGLTPTWDMGGERPLAFLHDVLTQDLVALAPADARIAALLTDKGRLRAVMNVLGIAGGAILWSDAESAAGIEEGVVRLAPLGRAEMLRRDRVLLRVAVDAVDAGDELSRSDGLRTLLGFDSASEGDHEHGERDGAFLAPRPFGADLLVLPAAAQAWVERIAEVARLITPEQMDARRIISGEPRYGVDVDASTLMNETPLLSTAVSFTKGCYPGQESVAKIHNLGRTNRTLLVLAAAAAAGDVVTSAADGSDVGRITSAAVDEKGDAVAFAFVRAGAGDLIVNGSPAPVLSVA